MPKAWVEETYEWARQTEAGAIVETFDAARDEPGYEWFGCPGHYELRMSEDGDEDIDPEGDGQRIDDNTEESERLAHPAAI